MPTSDIVRYTEKRKFSVYLTSLFISFVCASLIGVFCVINADRVSNKWCPQCQDTPSTHFYQVFIKARSHHLPTLVFYHYLKVYFLSMSTFQCSCLSLFLAPFEFFWFHTAVQSGETTQQLIKPPFAFNIEILHFSFHLIVPLWYQNLGHKWSQTEKMRIIIDQLCIGSQSTTTDSPN